MDCAAHFHGEQAESIWAEFNQLGARTRQMGSSMRHDTLCDQYGDWNWKKVVGMGTSKSHIIGSKT